MFPISWLQWFTAFKRSQKRIIECHNLIMYFRVSPHVLCLLEILHPHYSPALCLPFLLHSFISLLFSLSLNTHFPFFVSNFSIFPLPFLQFFHRPYFNPRVLIYISPSLHHHCDPFLPCFTFLHGQVAEQLAYYCTSMCQRW